MRRIKLIQTILFTSGLLLVFIQTGLAEQAASTPQEKTLYRSLNTEGVPEFSDQPGKGAEEIEITPLPTYTFPSPPKVTPTPKKSPRVTKQQPYEQLRILAPGQDEVIRDNTGQLTIEFALTPPLKTGLGHRLQFLIDGKPREPVTGPATFDKVYQGTHTLMIKLLDADQRVLMTSNNITFHKLRHSIKKSTE